MSLFNYIDALIKPIYIHWVSRFFFSKHVFRRIVAGQNILRTQSPTYCAYKM